MRVLKAGLNIISLPRLSRDFQKILENKMGLSAGGDPAVVLPG
jgi:hypothetical protein